MALTANRNTPARTMTTRTVPLYRSVKIYQGALVCINTTHGYGVPASATTTLIPIGVALEPADNTGGSDGTLSVPVESGEVYCFANGAAGSDFTAADRGAIAYSYDDATVAKSGTGASIMGVVEDVDTEGVWVRVGALADAALTAAAGAVSTLTTNLAKATTPGGASLVGLYDAAGKYAATTVEAAFAEDADAR